MNQQGQLLTIKEAASALRLHPETVRRLIVKEELEAKKFGNSWRIEPGAVLAKPSSTFTQADFEVALRKVSRKIEPKKGQS